MKNDPRTWPKLSETLPHPRHPQTCQSCGEIRTMDVGDGLLEVWRECDHKDIPTAIVVLLCPRCAERLIEPHPRLYHREFKNKPVPGAMPHLCTDCRFREALSCTHPNLKSNGGPGLLITVAEPTRGFIDGSRGGKRFGSMFETYHTPASACAGKQP